AAAEPGKLRRAGARDQHCARRSVWRTVAARGRRRPPPQRRRCDRRRRDRAGAGVRWPGLTPGPSPFHGEGRALVGTVREPPSAVREEARRWSAAAEEVELRSVHAALLAGPVLIAQHV